MNASGMVMNTWRAPIQRWSVPLRGVAILGGGVPVHIHVTLTPLSSMPGPILGELTYFDRNGRRRVETFYDEIRVQGDPDGAFQPSVRVKSQTLNPQAVRVMIRVG